MRTNARLSLGGLIVLSALTFLVVRDVTPLGEMSGTTWSVLVGLSIVAGAAVGWFCRPLVPLVALTFCLSCLLPYGFYYLPGAITEPGGLHEAHKWGPLILPKMMLRGSFAIWIPACIAHFARGRYEAGKSAEPCAPPNGGPAERLGNSGAGGGPPSVS
jgi:hypothetical protein